MKDVIEILESKPMFIGAKGAAEKEISEAEHKLSVSFSDEYKHYLSTIGFAVYEGHEITGICKAKRLNVVDVTVTERELSSNVSENWYVIEQLNIDSIVIWQSSTGEIYQTSPNATPIKICCSMAEYVNNGGI